MHTEKSYICTGFKAGTATSLPTAADPEYFKLNVFFLYGNFLIAPRGERHKTTKGIET